MEKISISPYVRRRRFGDRPDGFLVRTIQPMTRLMPYIMKRRCDALNTFADSVTVSAAERYCRDKVKEGYANFGTLHLLIAAYVRMLAKYPGVNRFVSGQKIYTRNNIEIVMTVKKVMTVESPDTVIKVVFEPTDTAVDVYEKFNKVVTESVGDKDDTSFDKTAKTLNLIPGFMLRFTVWVMECLDYLGILPKFLLKVSPFHGSMIITSMGSLGIKPIYHHIYDFGNLPVFISYGIKRDELCLNSDGTVRRKRVIDIKAVTDERICDGFYYAQAFRAWKRYVENPEMLDTPPADIKPDIE